MEVNVHYICLSNIFYSLFSLLEMNKQTNKQNPRFLLISYSELKLYRKLMSLSAVNHYSRKLFNTERQWK